MKGVGGRALLERRLRLGSTTLSDRRIHARVMSDPSATAAGYVDSLKRYDLLPIYCRTNATAAKLSLQVSERLALMATEHKRYPNLLSYEAHLPASRSAIFEAILQARGGGVALLLLSDDFFLDKWCLASLLLALEVQKSSTRAAKLKLRFFCIDQDAAKRLSLVFPQLHAHYEANDSHAGDASGMASRAARLVWGAWEGSAAGEGPTALGGTVERALADLEHIFNISDLNSLTHALDCWRLEASSVAQALRAGIRAGSIQWRDLAKLRDFLVREQSIAPYEPRVQALDAHRSRWYECEAWEWRRAELDSMTARALAAADEILRSSILQPRTPDAYQAGLAGDSADDVIARRRKAGAEGVIREASEAPPRPSPIYVPGVDDADRPEHKVKAVLMSTLASSTGARVVILGIGGIGKSTVCKGVLDDEEVKARFRNGICWVQMSNAANDDALASAIMKLVALLHQSDPAAQKLAVESLLSAKDLGELRIQAKSHISIATRKSAEHFLLVIDDCWRSQDLTELLEILPSEAAAIITTRLPSTVAVLTYSGVLRFEMGQMPLRAAEKLLGNLMQRTKPFSDLEKQQFVIPILKATHRLPLGIVIAGSMAADLDNAWKPVVEVVERCGIANDNFAMPAEMGNFHGIHKTIRSVLQASVNYINDKDTKLVRALRQLGVLPVNVVLRVDVLQKVWGDVDVKSIARQLRKFGLLQAIVNEGDIYAIELHTVIGAYALEELQRFGMVEGVHRQVIAGYREQYQFVGHVGEGGFEPFPTWRVADDGYLYENIARHAEGAADVGVAGELVLREWQSARDRQNPGLMFDTDLNHALRTLCAAIDGQEYLEEELTEKRGWLCWRASEGFRRLRHGDRSRNIENSILYLERWFAESQRTNLPSHVRVAACNALGMAYYERIGGKEDENLEKAVTLFKQAESMLAALDDPEMWAETTTNTEQDALVQHNIGLALCKRIGGDRSENFERAILHFERALGVYQETCRYYDAALAKTCIGKAYCEMIDDRTQSFDDREFFGTAAVDSYEEALFTFTRDAYPSDWAATMNNLGKACFEMIDSNRSENVERAIQSYECALKVYTRSAFPGDWAQTMNNLGLLYLEWSAGDDDIEKALKCFQESLQVYTIDAFPSDWASTMNNLGRAYCAFENGISMENVDRAIQCYEQALRVATRDSHRTLFSDTQYNLMLAHYTVGNASQALQAAREVEMQVGGQHIWGTQPIHIPNFFDEDRFLVRYVILHAGHSCLEYVNSAVPPPEQSFDVHIATLRCPILSCPCSCYSLQES